MDLCYYNIIIFMCGHELFV